MSARPWLDQRAALIRDGREGLPTANGAVRLAERFTKLFPEVPPETLGAVLIATGLAVNEAWNQLGDAADLETIACLIDITGEYLYAPPNKAGGS